MNGSLHIVETIVGPMLIKKTGPDLIEVKFLKESKVRLDAVVIREYAKVLMRISKGVPHRLLYDSNNSKTILTPEGLNELRTNQDKKKITKAAAFVKSDSISRFVINFYMKIKANDYPMKAFENRNDALAWLYKLE